MQYLANVLNVDIYAVNYILVRQRLWIITVISWLVW